MQTIRHPHPGGTPGQDAGPALDCETAPLLRGFLLPVFETATDWAGLRQVLIAKGYDIAFCDGHMVLRDMTSGRNLCTGAVLGAPLHSLAARLGRPTVRAHRGGATGELGCS